MRISIAVKLILSAAKVAQHNDDSATRAPSGYMLTHIEHVNKPPERVNKSVIS